MKPIVTRFAPSPSGFLHLGNARTALFSLLAALPDGRFLLRIEDTDRARVSAVFTDAVRADLDWLGFGAYIDQQAIWHQSAREAVYREHLDRLSRLAFSYPCFCSPAELAREREQAHARGLPPRYSGRCAHLPETQAKDRLARGEPAAWRFRVPRGETVHFIDRVRGPQTVPTDALGDFVIARASGEPMFFFANAIDDALSGVTLVLRGEDHLPNTPRQILLLNALKLPVPEYGHLPLVLGASGAPLSKREGAAGIGDLRDEGFLPLAIVNYLARLGATIACEHIADLTALARAFSVDHIGRAPAHFDRQQLLHWQRLALAQTSDETIAAWLPADVPVGQRAAFVRAVRPNATFAREFGEWAAVVYGAGPITLGSAAKEALQAVGRSFFDIALDALADQVPPSELPARLKAAGIGGKGLFHALRAALTGSLEGPEMRDLLVLMPPDIIRRRLMDSVGALC
ncbi:MAG: glutamate--tRNA ligase [Gammaproteobacteria bacterium]|nr:glutamate--tRNA ligase [Gammaproteobacteria bacterium]